MSEPWAEARVEASLDYGDIDEELARRLTRSIQIATQACQRHFQRLAATARTSANKAAQSWERAATRIGSAFERLERRAEGSMSSIALNAQRASSRMADAYERALNKMERDTSLAVTKIRAKLLELSGASASVKLKIDIDSAQAITRLRAVITAMQAFANQSANAILLRVDLGDTAAVEARILHLARDHTAHINVDVDSSHASAATREVSRLSRGLGSLGSGAGKLAGLGGSLVGMLGSVAKFTSLAGGAVVAAAAAIPVLAGLASALAAVGVAGAGAAGAGIAAAAIGFASIKTGLSGVSEAFKASGQAASGGGGAAEDTAKAVAAAQKTLTRAVRDEQDAQKDVATARRTALERLQDLNLEMRGGAINEAQAVLDLKMAQRDLAKGGFADGLEQEQAALRVKEAEQSLLETRERNGDLQAETQDANKKGVAGSDEVTAAQRKLADATEAVADARTALADAGKSSGGGGGGVDKMAEAMAKLAPNARATVQTLLDLKPAWTSIVQQPVQNAMFAGIAPQLQQLSDNYLPKVGSVMSGVATQFNLGAQQALRFTNSKTGISVMNTLLTQSGSIAGSFGRAIGNMAPGFAALGASASNVFAPMAGGIDEMATKFSDSMVKMQQSGQLDEKLKGALAIAKQLGAVFMELGSIIGGVFRAASAAGDGNGLANITNSLKAVSDWVNGPVGQGALTSFFQSVGAAVKAILPLFLQIAGIIGGQVAPMIADLITRLAPLLGPVIDAIGLAIAALAPAIGPLASALGSIIAAVAPIIPVIGQLIAQFVQMAGPIITTLMQALGPVIQALGPILGQALEAVMPVLMSLAQALGPVFALLPSLIQPFMTILSAVMPILSGLVEILGPILVQVITALTPVLTMIADTFAQVLEAVSPLLPILGEALTQILAALLPFISQMAEMWSQTVTALLPLIPPLLQIVEALLPPLIQVIVALLPLFTMMAVVISNLVPTIVPVVTVLANLLAMFAQIIAKVIEFAASVISTIVGFVVGFVNVVSGLPGQVIGFFKQLWDDAYALVETGVNKVVDFVKGLPGRITTAASGMWNGIVDAFKGAINSVIRLWNGLSLKLPEVDTHIPGIGKIGGFELGTPDIPLLAQGGTVPMTAGAVRGQDSVLAGLTPGEYVIPVNAVTPATLPILSAIRSGAIKGYAGGGLVSADNLNNFAKGVEGKRYDWGGVNWGDCSGAVSAIANFASGRDPFGSRFATGSEEGELAARGFLPGTGPAGSLNIGWYNGGEYGGHTAATLPNGTNFEMGGSRGDGQYGGGAAGAGDSMFTDHAYLPPEHFIGLDAGAPTVGAGGSGTAGPQVSMSGGGATSTPTTPSGGGSTTTPTTGTGTSSSTGAVSSSSMPYGQARANAYLKEQDLGAQGRKWGQDALKEVTGQFTDQVGLKGLTDTGLDALFARLEAAIVKQPPTVVNVGVQVDGKQAPATVTAGGPNQLAGMTPVTETLRSG